MARRNDLAGLAALGALGLLLNKKQDGSSVPVEDRAAAAATSDTRDTRDYGVDYSEAPTRGRDFMTETEPGWVSGTAPARRPSSGGRKPFRPMRDDQYNPDVKQGLIGSPGGSSGASSDERPLVDPERRKNYGMLESIKGYYSGNPFTAASAKREALNAMNATAGLSIPQFIGDKTQKQYNAAAAARRSAEGFSPAEARAARDAAEAAAQKSRDDKVLNPMAWMAGPKRMETDFKKGGKVKKAAPQRSSASSRGDGIAKRGKTRGRMF